MKQITETKINSKRENQQKKPDVSRQFDLKTAYKLLITAYLRQDHEEPPDPAKAQNK